MASPREKFQALLRDLFQFEAADLDFGIYRIMNHKRAVIERFIDKDLLDGVSKELASGALAHESGVALQLEEISAQIMENFGDEALDAEGNLAPQFATTPAGKQYLAVHARAAASKSRPQLEADIFNHLHAFFSRYYDDGDFMSLRRYSKRDKYAIPYNGEEVHLHWANADQYYIKTGENFTDFSYKHGGWTVQFKLRDADVEQNNVKGPRRFFIPRPAEIVLDPATRTLAIPFDYRPLKGTEESRYGSKKNGDNGSNGSGEENGGKLKKKGQEGIIADALTGVQAAAKDTPGALAALTSEKRRDADGKPVTLLEHHLRTYVRENTSDFFIHKDLGGFLSRELDFYIKNEVLNLDDLATGGETRSENWFQMMRAIKGIGRKIIAFVAQIENFQKRLFEKKKFVTEVHYCVTLDRVPANLYPVIAAEPRQIEEWKRLFQIQEIAGDLTTAGFKEPVSAEFLSANQFLVLDTRFFSPEFKDNLLSSTTFLNGAGGLYSAMDGLLIQSENSQALNILDDGYQGTQKCIYIDPPYNTDAGPILYKNDYRNSSWMTMIENRLIQARRLLREDGILCVTIDDYQVHELAFLLDRIFDRANQLGIAVIRNNPSGRSTVEGFSICHEYAFFYRKTDAAKLSRLPRSEKQLERFTTEQGVHVDWRNFRKDGGIFTYRSERRKQFYPVYADPIGNTIRIPNMAWDENTRDWNVLEQPLQNETAVWPIDEKGKERIWSFNQASARQNVADLEVRTGKKGDVQVFRRHIPSEGVLPRSLWDKNTYAAREYGSSALTDLFGRSSVFSFAKSPFAVQDCIWVAGLSDESDEFVLDFFGGSGTTGHAVINLNREDEGKRKYILVEVGDYFETVLKPRVQKVIYSKDWKDGKPVSRQGSSHAFKYMRLESYEDALDNICFQSDDGQQMLVMDEYLLSYMLDFETRESDTFLNVAKLDAPFDYKLHRHGKDAPMPVDLPETFNYLIGLHVASRRALENEGQRYLVYRGTSQGRETAVIWRTTRGWTQADFESDRKFIEARKLTAGAEDVFVNCDSFVPGARSLDPVFKKRMFNEEQSMPLGVDVQLEQRLVLASWALRRLGYASNKSMLETLRQTDEGFDGEGRSFIVQTLGGMGSKCKVSRDDLARYDANIRGHLAFFNRHLKLPLTLRYFQHLALLVTEMFLDMRFNHEKSLRRELNEFVEERNARQGYSEQDEEFTPKDLTKLAYWMATGSGKTILMHFHYRQFLHYCKEPLDNILLVTPDDGLSQQHIEQMELAGIPCERFSLEKSGREDTRKNTVRVIEITKFVETKKGSGLSVPVEHFEGNNLILVDEGHRGASSDAGKWIGYRDQLAATGFTFEYSATFGQAMTAAGDDEMTREYGRAILFDYSYKYFYGDGFGKDFDVLNLKKETTPDQTDMLLLANLLAFLEQKRAFQTRSQAMLRYHLADPLWIFVGSTVNKSKENKQAKESDVLTVVKFFSRFLQNTGGWVQKSIEKILEGHSGIEDEGHDIFSQRFRSLKAWKKSPEAIYRDGLARIFHADAGGTLHVGDIKGKAGELGLKVSGSDKYFGLIYIGDTSSFKTLLAAEASDVEVEEDQVGEGLFENIKRPQSPINILIGAKKFIQGWDSWRVTNMGLLNIGRSEGSEIIQLFGRGVRLQGLNRSLKRSTALGGTHPKGIELLERLNIFAIRANYMAQFREYLEREGIDPGGDVEMVLPIRRNDQFIEKGLIAPRLPEEARFAHQQRILLEPDASVRVTLDLSVKVERIGTESGKLQASSYVGGGDGWIRPAEFRWIDWSGLYLEMLEHKEAQGFHNLVIRHDDPKRILAADDPRLYGLVCDDAMLKPRSAADVQRLRGAAAGVLKKYLDNFYRKRQQRWDSDNMLYTPLEKDDPNFQDYKVKVPRGNRDLVEAVKEIIDEGKRIYEQLCRDLPAVYFDRHLYQPLLIQKGSRIKAAPPALNEGEQRFVNDLMNFCKSKPPGLKNKELFLLRNLSRGKGIGFFDESGFYPDFIVWVIDGTSQRLIFIDPKGTLLEPHPSVNSKINLHKKLQLYVEDARKKSGNKHLELDSFIVTVTDYHELRQKHGPEWDKAKYAESHLLFFDDTGDTSYLNQILPG